MHEKELLYRMDGIEMRIRKAFLMLGRKPRVSNERVC